MRKVTKWLCGVFGVGLSLGDRGEKLALRYLCRAGYRVFGRNLRTRFGELDIVAEDRRDGTIVIVEVKTTVSDAFTPEAHVDRRKQRKISALANGIVRRYGFEDRRIRFDVIAIVWPEGQKAPERVSHHENAFENMY